MLVQIQQFFQALKNLLTKLPNVFGKLPPDFQNFFRVLKIHILGAIFSLKLSLK